MMEHPHRPQTARLGAWSFRGCEFDFVLEL